MDRLPFRTSVALYLKTCRRLYFCASIISRSRRPWPHHGGHRLSRSHSGKVRPSFLMGNTSIMNFIFLLLLIAGVGWIIWRWRVKDRIELDRAWRLVLEDPNYEHRRRYYEHLVHSEKSKEEEDARIKKRKACKGPCVNYPSNRSRSYKK